VESVQTVEDAPSNIVANHIRCRLQSSNLQPHYQQSRSAHFDVEHWSDGEPWLV
jgi:hypothetical protein